MSLRSKDIVINMEYILAIIVIDIFCCLETSTSGVPGNDSDCSICE